MQRKHWKKKTLLRKKESRENKPKHTREDKQKANLTHKDIQRKNQKFLTLEHTATLEHTPVTVRKKEKGKKFQLIDERDSPCSKPVGDTVKESRRTKSQKHSGRH